MAEIRPYEQSVLPSGEYGGRSASAADFGAGIGAGLQQVGQGGMELAGAIEQQYQAEDATNVHVKIAKAQAEWTQTLKDRANSATPGDETFAPKLMTDMSQYFQAGANTFKTKAGQQMYQQLAASTMSSFGERAIGVQAQLAGKWAEVQNTELNTSLSSTAYTDPSQRQMLIEQGMRAVDDPKGIYSKVDQATRDHFKNQIKSSINFASYSKMAQEYPQEILKHIAPELVQEFGNVPPVPANQTGVVANGNPQVSASAQKWSPQVNAAASAKGVSGAILLAQLDQESHGNPAAINKGDIRVTGSASVGIAQFQPATAKRYGIDPTKPEEAIKGQAAYMSDLLNMFGGDYQKALAGYNWGEGNVQAAIKKYGANWVAHAPASTQAYISNIMTKSGATPATAPVVQAESASAAQLPSITKEPASVPSLDGFSDLTWEQQQHLVNTSQVALRAQQTYADRQRLEQDRIKKEAQNGVMNDMLTKIVTPSPNAPMPSDSEIMGNNTIDWQQKQHLVDYKLTRTRELATASESKTHPEAVRSLMLQIHAAEDDPRKTYNNESIMEAYRNNLISTTEMTFLRKEIKDMQDPNASPFTKRVNTMREAMHDVFTKSIEGSIQPEKSAQAYLGFTYDLDKAIAAKRSANQDPSVLLDRNSKEYFPTTHPMSSYMNPPSKVLATGAAQGKPLLPTYKEYESLPKGSQFTDPQGNIRTKP